MAEIERQGVTVGNVTISLMVRLIEFECLSASLGRMSGLGSVLLLDNQIMLWLFLHYLLVIVLCRRLSMEKAKGVHLLRLATVLIKLSSTDLLGKAMATTRRCFPNLRYLSSLFFLTSYGSSCLGVVSPMTVLSGTI